MFTLGKALQQARSISVLELGFNHITHVGLEYLLSSLCGYSSLSALHLDNNHIGDLGAEMLAAALPTMTNLELLDVGFNSISTAGIRPVMTSLRDNTTIKSLTLSGNVLDPDGAKAVAWALEGNARLEQLYLDHASIGPQGEKSITSGINSNRNLKLKTFTGFRLGSVMVRLGCPPGFEGLTNEQTLDILRNRSMGNKRESSSNSSSSSSSSDSRSTSTAGSCGLSASAMPKSSGAAFSFVPDATKLLTQTQAADLNEIAKMAFEPSDLWMLHQYYFSPVPNLTNKPNHRPPMPSAGLSTVQRDSEDFLPPTKRPCNNSTKTRVSCYPRLKVSPDKRIIDRCVNPPHPLSPQSYHGLLSHLVCLCIIMITTETSGASQVCFP